MVETEYKYNVRSAAKTLLQNVESTKWRVIDNSFERKPLSGEKTNSITVSLGERMGGDNDNSFVSITFSNDAPEVNVNGFEFVASGVEQQLKFCEAVFESALKDRRFQKKRLNPFKMNYVYEMTVDHKGNKLVLQRWDSETKLGLKTKDALAALGVKDPASL